jgi:hypothetical protein
MYNFADSSVTASAFTSGANTALTLVATTAGLTTTAALVIYFDDQATSSTVTGTVELGPTSLNALESITVTMGQVTVTGGLTDVQLRASAVTVGGTVTVGNFPASQAVTFSAVTGSVSVLNFPASQAVTFTDASLTNTQLRASAVTVGGTVTVGNSLTISSLPAISGTVTANVTTKSFVDGLVAFAADETPIFVEVAPGTNRIGVVTIGGGTVTIGAGTAQIGSVTASISGWLSSVIAGAELNIGGSPIQATNPVPARIFIGTGSGAAVSAGNPMPIFGTVTIGSLPALVAGTAQIGSVTASISGTVPISISSVTVGNSVTIGSLPAISGTVTANTFALQGTAVTTSNFTSTTASTVLASFNATREVLTIFNEGAGNLHVCVGATCTTVQYQVRLSSGDYYEVPNHQTTITHSAVFATAGTARVTQVS